MALAAAIGVLVSATAASASSVTYHFGNNIGGNTSVSGTDFSVTVSDIGGNKARFEFTNSGPASSSITGIYFYDGAIIGSTASIDNTYVSGTFVEHDGTPGNLPGGNPYGLTNATKEFYSHTSGIEGVYVGETLVIDVGIKAGQSFADVIAALNSGIANIASGVGFQTNDLIIGLHVQGMPGSDQFLTGGIPQQAVAIPLPAPVWMGLAGLVGVGLIRKRYMN